MSKIIAKTKVGVVQLFFDGRWYDMPAEDARKLAILLLEAASVAAFTRDASVEQAEELLFHVQRRENSRPSDRPTDQDG